MKANAYECDNPACSNLGRRDKDLAGPEGWLEQRLLRVEEDMSRRGSEHTHVFCSPTCLIEFVDATYPTPDVEVRLVARHGDATESLPDPPAA